MKKYFKFFYQHFKKNSGDKQDFSNLNIFFLSGEIINNFKKIFLGTHLSFRIQC